MVRKGSPKAVLRTPQRLYSRGGDLPLRAIAHETESREAGDHHRSGLSKRAGEMSRETKKSMNPRSPTIICPASKPSHFAQPDCPRSCDARRRAESVCARSPAKCPSHGGDYDFEITTRAASRWPAGAKSKFETMAINGESVRNSPKNFSQTLRSHQHRERHAAKAAANLLPARSRRWK
jgi:hypothetical protein